MRRIGFMLLAVVMLSGMFPGGGTTGAVQVATPETTGADDLGRFRAVFTGAGAPVDGGRCPALTIAIEGPGMATHLGSFTTVQDHCIDPTGIDPLAFTDGVYTFTAADGSSIAGRYSGRLLPTESTAGDDLYLIDGRWSIDAGTGRFAGATGGGGADGLQNPITGEVSLVLDGIIASPSLAAGGAASPEATPVS